MKKYFFISCIVLNINAAREGLGNVKNLAQAYMRQLPGKSAESLAVQSHKIEKTQSRSLSSSKVEINPANTELLNAKNLVQVSKALLKGAAIDCKDENGNTPLYLAVKNGNSRLIEVLLNRGADINVINGDGKIAFDQIEGKGFDAALKERLKPVTLISIKEIESNLVKTKPVRAPKLTKTPPPVPPKVWKKDQKVLNEDLKKALLTGSKEDVEKSLMAGGNVNFKDDNGISLLHMAVQNDIEKVRVLLNDGADVNVKDNNGMTPLFWAANRLGSIDTIKLLLSHGADVNMKDNNFDTPLHMASARDGNDEIAGGTNIVKLLVSKGADFKAKNKEGEMPQDYASNPNTVSFLRELNTYKTR